MEWIAPRTATATATVMHYFPSLWDGSTADFATLGAPVAKLIAVLRTGARFRVYYYVVDPVEVD